jgi:hypothetical protein
VVSVQIQDLQGIGCENRIGQLGDDTIGAQIQFFQFGPILTRVLEEGSRKSIVLQTRALQILHVVKEVQAAKKCVVIQPQDFQAGQQANLRGNASGHEIVSKSQIGQGFDISNPNWDGTDETTTLQLQGYFKVENPEGKAPAILSLNWAAKAADMRRRGILSIE